MTSYRPAAGNEVLSDCWREFEASGEEGREVADRLTTEQLWWRPGPDRWSVGECLDHLVRTGEAYLEALEESIDDARRKGLVAGDGGSHRPTLVGRWLVRVLEPPPGLRVAAPGEIRPRRPEAGGPAEGAPGGPSAGDTGPSDPLGRFLALRPRFGERLEAADGLDLGGARVTSPFFRWLRFDLGSAFRIVAAHERRHLWQARQVRESEGFPVV